jgi:CheY-like chemotaxis protein
MAKRVLSIGNCGFDNGSLRSLFSGFGAELVAADDWDEAQGVLQDEQIDLVLVNRKLDADGSDGLDIIGEIKQSPQFQSVPVMLLSNYPEYQAKAVAAGAEPGFGKAQIQSQATRQQVARYLS